MNKWIERIWTFILACLLLIPLAYFFVEGLERSEYADQARLAKHFEAVMLREVPSVTDTQPPAPPTGVRLAPDQLAVPKTRAFKDTSRPSAVLERQNFNRLGIK